MNRPGNIVKNSARMVFSLSPSCKAVGRLQSAALDRPLTLPEKVGLRFHLVLCKWCRRYGKQIRFLHLAARDQQAVPQALSQEARERIQRRLQSETG